MHKLDTQVVIRVQVDTHHLLTDYIQVVLQMHHVLIHLQLMITRRIHLQHVVVPLVTIMSQQQIRVKCVKLVIIVLIPM